MRRFTKSMEVRKVRAYSAYYAEYSLCPNCGIPMGREYQNYCSNCGQKLAWNDYREGNLEMEYRETESHTPPEDPDGK